MIIREVSREDLEAIEYLNKAQEDFKLSGIESCIIDRIAYENGEVVAYGIVKKMAEAIILTDPKIPNITRARAMRELMKFAQFGSKKFGCEQLHCFVKDAKLIKTLEHHFGFVRTKDIVLVKNL